MKNIFKKSAMLASAILLSHSQILATEPSYPITIKTLKNTTKSIKGLEIKISKLNKDEFRFSAKNTNPDPFIFNFQETYAINNNFQFYINRFFNPSPGSFHTPVDVKIMPNMTIDLYLIFNENIKYPCKIYICDTLVAEVIEGF